MGSGSPTLKMVTHTRTLLLLLLGVTVLDVKGQSVVFPSNGEDAIVIENPRKIALSSLPMRWKRLNRLKNMWSERDNNKTNIMSKPMDNEVEWGTEIFETRSTTSARNRSSNVPDNITSVFLFSPNGTKIGITKCYHCIFHRCYQCCF